MIGIHIAMTSPHMLIDIIAPTTPVETFQVAQHAPDEEGEHAGGAVNVARPGRAPRRDVTRRGPGAS